MNPLVRFDDDADAEYRVASQWYEAQREHLGVEFLDAVDATIDRIVAMPRAGSLIKRLPSDVRARRRAVTRFPYHVVYLEMATHIEFSRSLITTGGRDTGNAALSSPGRSLLFVLCCSS